MKITPLALAFLMAFSSSVYAQESKDSLDKPMPRKEMRQERRGGKAADVSKPQETDQDMRRSRRGGKDFERLSPRKEMRQGRAKPLRNLAQELSLTEEQKAEYQRIHQKGREQIQPLMEKIQKIRQENMEAFEKILTPEQLEKFSKMKVGKKGAASGKKGKGRKHHKREE